MFWCDFVFFVGSVLGKCCMFKLFVCCGNEGGNFWWVGCVYEKVCCSGFFFGFEVLGWLFGVVCQGVVVIYYCQGVVQDLFVCCIFVCEDFVEMLLGDLGEVCLVFGFYVEQYGIGVECFVLVFGYVFGDVVEYFVYGED